MELRDLLNLILRVTCIPFHHDLSDDRPRPWFDSKSEVDLVLLRDALLGDFYLRLVKSIFIEYPLQVRQRPLELFLRVELPKLQTAAADQLVGGGIAGDTFRRNLADEIVGDRQEA